MITRARVMIGALLVLLSLGVSAAAQVAAPIVYSVTFPEPEHHWAQVEVRFDALGAEPLKVRMSRASPGRYAVHEFVKNIFAIEAFSAAGEPLPLTRSGVDEWRVDRHDGAVRIVYRIFGDHPDGTYMAVDTTHAHLNMPATFLWGVGLDERPIRVTFVPPPDSGWTVGTQLFPTADPFAFTAPNLQYFLDSPTELARFVTARFRVDGTPRAEFRVMVHGDVTQADVTELARLVERLVLEQRAVFGELPPFDDGTYTFLLDYVGWSSPDAMEHRNSTMVSDPGASLSSAEGRRAALDSISHELFHIWNVERIRPAGLEPFDYTRANVTCCLWLGEGFTNYYGSLLLRRAGLVEQLPLGAIVTVINGPGRQVRSAVEMSEHAPFADAAVTNDAHDRSRTYISYYTHGEALALALDLSLRERSRGRISLDDFMRAMWRQFGRETDPRPGYVARPYTLADARRVLGEVAGDAPFADDFFREYIEGRNVPDYTRLLALAGYTLRRTAPDRGWIGGVAVQEEAGGLLVGGARWSGQPALAPFGTPIYDAGVDAGDVIRLIDGRPATLAAWRSLSERKPGDVVRLEIQRRDGRRVSTQATLAADPALQIIPSEMLGTTLTPAQRAFRDAWLGSRR